MAKKWLTMMFIICLSVFFAACTKEKNTEETPEPQATAESKETAAPEATPEDITAQWDELKIQVSGYRQTGNNVPVEDVLTPIWRSKTKVIPEIVGAPQGTSGDDWIARQVTADTLPEVLGTIGVAQGTNNYKLLKENKKIREITKEDLIKYMPRYVARIEKLGGTIDQVYEDNLDSADGKLWWIPNQLPQSALPGYRGTRYFEEQTNFEPYQSYVRDDILKEIFPEVKTEEELKQLYKDNGGKLSYGEVTDIPIHNMADLLDFYRKIKALNKKVGDKPVYAAHPHSSSSNVNSLVWSMFSAPGGNMWTITGESVTKEDTMTYMPMTPVWKDYLKWFNTAYNEGLLDPESFIQKDDQLNAKVINGEYAVINWWAPVADARKLSKAEGRGYGYRLLPMFDTLQLNSEYQDVTAMPTSLNGSFSGVVLTTTLKDEDYAQVMNWIDWNMSEEADELRTWGLPEWSAGTGKDRRFKPEYKYLETWAISGAAGAKDGNYYGMYDILTNASTNAAAWNHETYGILGLVYPDSPRYTYPKDLTKDVDLDLITHQVLTKHFMDQIVYYRQKGWDLGMIDPEGKFAEIDATNGIYSHDAGSAVVKTIVGKPADFEKNYEKYMAVFNDKFKTELAARTDKYKDLYNTYIKPEVNKVKK